MKNPDSDDVLLNFDSCFKSSLGLGDACSKDPTALEPKKKKRKSAPIFLFQRQFPRLLVWVGRPCFRTLLI